MIYDGIHAPVRAIPTDDDHEPTQGRALCLSGGGFRAMLFHLGVVWRLNDAGRLPGLTRISSVSGGSFTAGVLAAGWADLDFDERGVGRRFAEVVAQPLVDFAGCRVDAPAVLTGLVLPGVSGGQRLGAALAHHLYGDKTLQDLPDFPRFIFNATNLETGSIVRFSKASLADWQVGAVLSPRLPLAMAVACSSAFPPFLSPYVLDLSEEEWVSTPGSTCVGDGFRERMSVVDGGVYDNLGLETAWQQCREIIVSDAGGALGHQPDPHGDWGRNFVRVLQVIDAEVRTLRRAQIRDALASGERTGMYVGIGTDLADCPVADPWPVDQALTRDLARVPTRLTLIPMRTRQRLVNWGYVLADGWLRASLDPAADRGAPPYARAGLATPVPLSA